MIQPKKRLGQNFLKDPNTARRIVDALQAPAEAAVVEIGPGTGALTGALAARWQNFLALEVDERAVDHLGTALPGVAVRHQDVLAADWAALADERGSPLYVIGNLPYYITSPILFSLLDARRHLAEAVVMMQLEVAERLVAAPRTKQYGILSVQTQLFAHPTLLFRVSRNVFHPKPAVTSAVVRLDFSAPPIDAHPVDPMLVRSVIRAAFNQRRKTLHNSLHAWTREKGIRLPEPWARSRAEALTPAAFVALASYLSQA